MCISSSVSVYNGGGSKKVQVAVQHLRKATLQVRHSKCYKCISTEVLSANCI